MRNSQLFFIVGWILVATSCLIVALGGSNTRLDVVAGLFLTFAAIGEFSYNQKNKENK